MSMMNLEKLILEKPMVHLAKVLLLKFDLLKT